jgi:hypothetical protein
MGSNSVCLILHSLGAVEKDGETEEDRDTKKERKRKKKRDEDNDNGNVCVKRRLDSIKSTSPKRCTNHG